MRTRSDVVREDIFNRAMALFEKQGFRGTSMREIAEICGVTKPAIYHYFKSKSEFLKTLYDFMTEDFFERTESIAASNLKPSEKLRHIVKSQALYSITNRRMQRVLLQDRHELEAPEREALIKQEQAYEHLVSNLIKEGQADGSILEIDTRIAMLSILGLLSSVHRWVGRIDADPEVVADGIADLVMRAILLNGAPERAAST